MNIEAIHEFIISRAGAVQCMGCSGFELIPQGEALVCPKCRTEHREDGWTVRKPVAGIDTSNKPVNWGSYQDYAKQEQTSEPQRACEAT